MTTQEIKEKIHKLVDDSPEDKLEHVYSILTTEYSDEFKSMLDAEFEDYQKNPDGDTREDVNKMIAERMNRK